MFKISSQPLPQNDAPKHKGPNKDRLFLLVAVLLALIIAGNFGYRLEISPKEGITFEPPTKLP